MPKTITIKDAQARLAEIIAALTPGEELFIMKDERAVAKLVAQESEVRLPRKPGSAVGKLIIHADDNEHLADFEGWIRSQTMP